MAGIPPDTGALMSAVLEGILYGFSVLMFMGTIWALTYKSRMQDINRPIAMVAILLLLVSTVHMIVTIIRVENGFVKYRDTWPGGPAAFFADITEETYVIKHALYIFQTVVADGVMVYRCYVVWQSIRVIILPSMLWCGIVVTGIHAVYSVSQASSNPGDVFASQLTKWITAFFASTITTNLLCSGLLAYRIWMTERAVSRVRATSGTMMPIVRILVDAAVLYSIVLFSLLICFLSGNNGEGVLTDLVMPVISIAFYMVLIRITFNRKKHSHISKAVFSTPRGTTGSGDTEQGILQQYPMKPLQVNVPKFTHEDSPLAYRVDNEDQLSPCKVESL
ncbi:hypothetical protein DEU56DRAFT_343655 [Suillus clintonianus]|uniref:uncharacterized protein n=1 Tax=Suillus clintonianus TaxID=1904413 RepID=UPI001B86548C|nr:uncharacterized protein DEU56DRAFT_343655 [Suillus clintonianus]KAG2137927.1 hypothetical protein DEU56DRAFT_343655 [Suillus clintonianus]